ncbi:MAG: TetR/AcrR family transcriptional regulator [Actinomycetota bacterium]|nr:TetR/AcrR family transcriptional regulator [Actinomycetota bacterium]
MRPKTMERRRQLVALSTRGIFEQGYDRFSVNHLAAEAGLSVGGIYRYITTKSDLLVMACEDIYGGLYEALVQTIQEIAGCEAQLRSAFALYLESCETAKDQVLLLYREYQHLPRDEQRRYKDREARIADFFAEIITAGHRSGEFGEADARTVAQDMVLLGHLPALKSWTLGERRGQRLVNEQVDFVVAGLTGRQNLEQKKRSPVSAASSTVTEPTEPEGTP